MTQAPEMNDKNIMSPKLVISKSPMRKMTGNIYFPEKRPRIIRGPISFFHFTTPGGRPPSRSPFPGRPSDRFRFRLVGFFLHMLHQSFLELGGGHRCDAAHDRPANFTAKES